jgi:hypothetical protein
MKKGLLISCALVTASGCAFKGDVQRMGVDFNSTVANTANELTLLNVLRAKDYHPLHFTSFSAVRGKIQVTGGATLGGTIQGAARKVSESLAGEEATVGREVARGVETITPGLSAELATGPDFDVAVYDTQEFYQGITSSVPTETVAHLLYQGWPSDLLSYLLVQRVNFRTAEDIEDHAIDPATNKKRILVPKGTLVQWIETAPHDEKGSALFENFIRCYEMSPVLEGGKPTTLVPVSRLAQLKLEDLKLLDGKTLDLSQAVSASAAEDAKALVQRPEDAEDRLRIFPVSENGGLPCRDPKVLPGFVIQTRPGPTPDGERKAGGEEHSVPVTTATLGLEPNSDVNRMLRAAGRPPLTSTTVNVEFVFRSVEGAFQFLGDYIRTADDIADGRSKSVLYRVDANDEHKQGRTLFELAEGRSGGKVLVGARHLGRNYFVVADAAETHKPTMQVLALLQQLVNLQKKSTDKPTTQSVRLLD